MKVLKDMNLTSKIESLLFVAAKALTIKKISEITGGSVGEVKEAVILLKKKYSQEDVGLQLLENNQEIQLATNPQNSALVKEYLKDEMTGELTRPSLEALTIIAYRGPITKLELEQIRGVNCSLILRNLLLRGLIKEEEDKEKGQSVFFVTLEFLRHLGLREVGELPDYEKLHSHDLLERLLNDLRKVD